MYSIGGSTVTEWLEIPFNREQVLDMANMDKHLQAGKDRPFALFDKTKELCSAWAKHRGVPVNSKQVTLLNSERTAIFGRNNGILISPRLAFSSVLAHEMVHSLNIGHSYSERRTKIFPHAAPGEYGDRYDLMSTANAWMRPSRFGWAGPGLVGPHLDYLGWLPANRMLYFGRNNPSPSREVRLSSLSLPHAVTTGHLLVLLPYDRDEPGNVYTVELRTPVGNDAGIQQSAVVIHQVRRIGHAFYSFLVQHAGGYDELTEGTEWVRFIDNSSVIRVRVNRLVGWHDALLSVSSTFDPKSCREDEERVPLRTVDSVKDVLADEEESEEQRLIDEVARMPAAWNRSLGFSPLRFVCVEREENSTSNGTSPLSSLSYSYTHLRRQRARQDFFRNRRTYGQNECVEGRVWRAIDPYDYVCVPPSRVMEARRAGRVFIMANGDCPEKLVPRQAFPSDRNCVSEHERALILSENREAALHFKYASFFNGADPLYTR